MSEPYFLEIPDAWFLLDPLRSIAMVWIVVLLVVSIGILVLRHFWATKELHVEHQRNKTIWDNLNATLADLDAILKSAEPGMPASTTRVLRQAEHLLKKAQLAIDECSFTGQLLERTLLEIQGSVSSIRQLCEALNLPLAPSLQSASPPEPPVRG
ncbi:hypothetical protein [Silvimonas iriomotensis]|uniref:Uncharacterized protein n=1 Tax=Silvimonas iriomotensis TaxID=449662 RepID=A0ABQ2PC20_9NEIS|nr:hypothetical protein [Silvimonas iriomotensis]GGP23012.1 hypothetical protein GCM10010970_30120 [Silvimonas iriomotensis]